MPPRRSKRDKGPYVVRIHVADNVRALRDRKYGSEGSDTAKNRKLAAAVDCAPSQIQRIINGRTLGTSIDTIEDLARVFEVRPQDLLTPYFTAQFIASTLPATKPPAESSKRPPHRRTG